MIGGNAAALYGFDLTQLASLVARIGPHREELSQPLAPEEFPEKTMTGAFRT